MDTGQVSGSLGTVQAPVDRSSDSLWLLLGVG